MKAESLEKFDRILNRSGPTVLFLIYLLTAFPDEVISFVAGLTKIPIRVLLIVSIAGKLPGYLLLSFAGEGLAEGDANPYVVSALGILAIWKRRWLHDFVSAEDRGALVRDSWPFSAAPTVAIRVGLVFLSGLLLWAAFVPPIQ